MLFFVGRKIGDRSNLFRDSGKITAGQATDVSQEAVRFDDPIN
jgi:hypothetical protein